MGTRFTLNRVALAQLHRKSGHDGRNEDVAVYHVDLTPNPAREAAARALLNEEESERAGRFYFAEPRRRFVLCRAALRSLICERLGCNNSDLDFYPTAYGKPIALVEDVPADVNFSVSHSGGHGLIAIAGKPLVGVDIEDRNARLPLDQLMDSVPSLRERQELATLEPDASKRSFLDMWTLKEALIKAVGLGLRMPLQDIEIPDTMKSGTASGMIIVPQAPGIRWRLTRLGGAEFAAAIAQEIRADADCD